MTVLELVIPFQRNKRPKSVTTAGRQAGRSYWLFPHIIEVDSLRASRSARNHDNVNLEPGNGFVFPGLPHPSQSFWDETLL